MKCKLLHIPKKLTNFWHKNAEIWIPALKTHFIKFINTGTVLKKSLKIHLSLLWSMSLICLEVRLNWFLSSGPDGSGQLYSQKKNPSMHIGVENEWLTEIVYTWYREKNPTSTENRTPSPVHFYLFIIVSGVRLNALGTAATTGLLYQPQMIDDGDCGEICGIKIGKGNRSTRRKPAPAPLCPPQIQHDQTRARTPGRRGGKPATNRLSYGAAIIGRYWFNYFRFWRFFVADVDPAPGYL
jgi:hypothetical protein